MWLPEDTALALAWAEEQRLRCSGCGDWLDETTRPEAEDAFEAEARVCFRCRAVGGAARAFAEGRGDTSGVHWLVHDEREEVTGG